MPSNRLDEMLGQSKEDFWANYKAAQPKQEDLAEARRMTGVGEEGFFKSALIGTGKAFSDTVDAVKQLGAWVTGDDTELKELKQKQLEERQLYSKIGSPVGAFIGNMVGQGAQWAAPGGLALKAAKAAMPAAGALKSGLVTGAALGAAGGAAMPLAPGETVGKNALVGAIGGGVLGGALGAASPLIGKAFNAVANRNAGNKYANELIDGMVRTGAASKADVNKYQQILQDIPDEQIIAALETAKKYEQAGMRAPALFDLFDNPVVKERVLASPVSEASRVKYLQRHDELAGDIRGQYDNMNDLLDEAVRNKTVLLDSANFADDIITNAKKEVQAKTAAAYDKVKQMPLTEADREVLSNSTVLSNEYRKLVSKNSPYADSLDELNNMHNAEKIRMEKDLKRVNEMMEQNREKILTSDKYADAIMENHNLGKLRDEITQRLSTAKDTESFYTLALIKRQLRGKIDEARQAGNNSVAGEYQQVLNKLNDHMNSVSPALKEADALYAKTVSQYAELNSPEIKALAKLKGNELELQKFFDAMDPQGKMKTLDSVIGILKSKGASDEMITALGKRWLANKFLTLNPEKDVSIGLLNILGKKGNWDRIQATIKDPQLIKALDTLRMLSKNYINKSRVSIHTPRLKVLTDDYATREGTNLLVKLISKIPSARMANRMLDTSKWSDGLLQLLSRRKAAQLASNPSEAAKFLQEFAGVLSGTSAVEAGYNTSKQEPNLY